MNRRIHDNHAATEKAPATDAGVQASLPPPPRLRAALVAICLLGALAGWVLQPSPWALAAYVTAYLAGGVVPTAGAVRLLMHRRLSVDLLMIVAAAGAAFLGEWLEGAALLFLFSLSNTLEDYALFRTTRSVRALMKHRPNEAWRVTDAGEVRLPVEALRVGDHVRVRPGELFPVDGIVAQGATAADEATLTGESTPVAKQRGDDVFAGTLNQHGSVLVRMDRPVGQTSLERIIALVRQAQAEKPATQRFVESWQQPYVAGVLLASATLFVGSYYLLHDRVFGEAFYHAMVLLVAASPCAVIASAPSVVLSAIARAARHGVLFKGGQVVETLGHIETFAFDKTGTITSGRPMLATPPVMTDPSDDTEPPAIEPTELNERQAALLALAAAVEQYSEHHLAEPILAAVREHGLTLPEPVEDFENQAGFGVHARVGPQRVWVGVGREQLFASHGVELPEALRLAASRLRASGQTALIVYRPADDHGGVIGVADQPREDAIAALRMLRDLGVRRLIILTGDHARVARAVADTVGADEVRAELLPEQKVLELRRLGHGGRLVAMVGDGVNDAPALAAAVVGVGMGGVGTDVALEVSDLVLVRDDLRALAFAVWLSRRAHRHIRQNLAIAFGTIGLLVISSFLGLPLWLSVLAHEGSTVLVVANGLRIMAVRSGVG